MKIVVPQQYGLGEDTHTHTHTHIHTHMHTHTAHCSTPTHVYELNTHNTAVFQLVPYCTMTIYLVPFNCTEVCIKLHDCILYTRKGVQCIQRPCFSLPPSLPLSLPLSASLQRPSINRNLQLHTTPRSDPGSSGYIFSPGCHWLPQESRRRFQRQETTVCL